MDWRGVDYFWCVNQLFGRSFWRHPFTAEDLWVSKWCNAIFLQIWWRHKLINIFNLKLNFFNELCLYFKLHKIKYFWMIYIVLLVFHERGPMSFELLWILQGHFLGLTCFCSYECPNPVQFKFQFTHWTKCQNYQFNGSDLPLWMLACVNVSFYDSLSKQLVVYVRTLCIHPEP